MAGSSFGIGFASDLGMLRLLGPATVYISTLVASANDGVDLPDKPRMIHVSTAGVMKVTAGSGTTGLIAWEVGWHPVSVDRIWLTGLTAVGELWR